MVPTEKDIREITFRNNDTTELLYVAMDLDPEDLQKSAIEKYEKYADDIFAARQYATTSVVENWVTEVENPYTPDPNDLRTAALNISTSAAVETIAALPNSNDEIEYFWYEVGSAIYGADIEERSNERRVDVCPLTSDGLFHNSRSDRNQFQRSYEVALEKLRTSKLVKMHENVPVTLPQAAD